MKSGWDPTGTSEDDGPRHGQGIPQQRNICDPSARPELCRQRGGVRLGEGPSRKTFSGFYELAK